MTLLTAPTTTAGSRRWSSRCPAFVDGRRLVAVVSILDDKAAAGMLAPLLGLCDDVIVPGRRNPRGRSPPPSLARSPAARRRGRRCGRSAGAGARAGLARPDGVVLATGSLYLIAT